MALSKFLDPPIFFIKLNSDKSHTEHNKIKHEGYIKQRDSFTVLPYLMQEYIQIIFYFLNIELNIWEKALFTAFQTVIPVSVKTTCPALK
jgi:hypothetical protein